MIENKEKIDKIVFGIIIIVLIAVMCVFINQKEGFHEDEIFSYGSSNYKYDNIYQQFGKSDAINAFLTEKVIDNNPIQMAKNFKYYFIDHKDEKDSYISQIQKDDIPIWRSSKEAKEYATIDKEDILNYVMVYYNQSRDIHPPLFYFVVHTVSIFFYGVFSKYIIFIINLSLFVASCFILRKIMRTLKKEHLSNIVVLLYGLGMGAITTVMFQRMYMGVTLFTLWYFLINLKIINNNFEIDKKSWMQLGIITLLGFLTQFYFCIMAVLISIFIFIGIIKNREKKEAIKFVVNYIKIAVIGIIIFPKSIEDIFFSYRGVGAVDTQTTFATKLIQNINLISYSYSIPLVILGIALVILIIAAIYKVIKNNEKVNVIKICAIAIPSILYLFIVSKISPFMEYKYMIRYVMCIIPFLAINIVLLIDYILENRRNVVIVLSLITLIISSYGFINSEPKYLFRGYSKYLEVAEKNKDDNFVFIGNTTFNQIQSIPEFMIYNETLILNENQLDYLINNDELKYKNEFILSIKKYLGADDLMKKVLEKTGFNNYEVLLDDSGDVGCIIYRVIK